MIEQLQKEVKIQALSNAKKLLVDEMKVKESLVYDKLSGKIVGFVDLGHITNELIESELQNQSSKSNHRPIADHILLFLWCVEYSLDSIFHWHTSQRET